MTATLDDIMERASQALAVMDYLTCEALCLDALRAAREEGDWANYARVLLPLQEVRRQRRIIAADGHVRLGVSEAGAILADLDGLDAGCLVLTRPCSAEQTATFAETARRQRKCLEVLFADNEVHTPVWRITSFAGPRIEVERPAPPPPWRDRLLTPAQVRKLGAPGPADWFIGTTEALGDAALAQVAAPEGSIERIEQLEAMVHAAGDHEILHQRLGDAARAAGRAPS